MTQPISKLYVYNPNENFYFKYNYRQGNNAVPLELQKQSNLLHWVSDSQIGSRNAQKKHLNKNAPKSLNQK